MLNWVPLGAEEKTPVGQWWRSEVGRSEAVWRSLLIRAAAVQRVNHEGQVRPCRHHGVTWLHHLKANVVERPDDRHWQTKTTSHEH